MHSENVCQTKAQSGYHVTNTVGILLLCGETLRGSGTSDLMTFSLH